MPSQIAETEQTGGRLHIGPHPDEPGVFRLESRLLIPAPLSSVFEFFSDAGNLETLTPSWIRFRIVTPRPIEMQAGTLIDYRLRIRGLLMKWRSVISTWEPPHRFVDEQVHGPYRSWHHEHRFEARDGGTLVSDTVDYRVPGGRLINRLFVQPDVERIFRFRIQKLGEVFGESAPQRHT
jgi:ligand-binding SRPBCC domain-containing protein